MEVTCKNDENLSREEMSEKLREMLFEVEKRECTDNSIILMNSLDKLHLPHGRKYVNKENHPDFDKEFPPKVPEDGYMIFNKHVWTTIVGGLYGDILIDIDEYENAPGSKYYHKESSDIRSKERVYQRDGMDAYAIQCSGDKTIDDDTPVLDLVDGGTQPFDVFLSFLCFMQLTPDQQDEIINDTDKK